MQSIISGKLRIGMIDEQADGVHHLAEVVGRDIGGHTHRDAGGAVDQQVGEPGGQHHRLLETVVVVRGEIHRLLLDIRQHIQRHLAHPGLGVAVGRGGMPVDGTEVSVSVHQGIPQGKILSQPDHGVVDGGIAVRMVAAQHGAHRVGALAVRLIRGQIVFMHGIQDRGDERA